MQHIEFTDSTGHKRIGILVDCLFCKKEFATRKPQKNKKTQKYCSQECRNKHRKNQTAVEVSCAWCSKKLSRVPCKLSKSKSGLYFCNRQCKEKAQSLSGGISEIMPPHYGNGIEKYRDKFSIDELYCRRCGYKEFISSVQVHHIDEDRTNNNITNLIPLCANCHQALHNKHWTL